MNIRKTVKKIAALAAGATMLGATIMGAMAYDLSNYPQPFVKDGIADAKIVIGEKADAQDVVGAIDIAASLQADATTITTFDVPGVAGEVTVSGDSFQFETSSDILEINERIGSVTETLTEDDLTALKSGIINTGESTSPVRQYLKFASGTSALVVYGGYEVDDEDMLGSFLKFADGEIIFEYEMEFTQGAESNIDTGVLEDLEGEVLTFLGVPYTIVAAEVDDWDVSLTFLGGQVADTLRDGETKTYTIDGNDYEVSAVFISSGTDESAKLSVNGHITKELNEGETDVLPGDVTIGIQEILTNQREGIVEFYIGAEKVIMTDSNYSSATWTEGDLEVGGDIVSDGDVQLSFSTVGSDLQLNGIKYRFAADDTYYVPEGHGIREYLEDEAIGLLVPNWDVKYYGLKTVATKEIKIDSSGDDQYNLVFENVRGDVYEVPLVNTEATFKYGNDDDSLIYTEFLNATPDNWDDVNTFIPDDAYFAISDKDDAESDSAVTTVLRYKSIDDNTGTGTVTFQTLAGESLTFSYDGTPGTDATGTMKVAGKDHIFYVGADEGLAIDLDASGAVTNADYVNMVAVGGAIIRLPTQTYTQATGAMVALGTAINVTVTTLENKFDNEDGNVNVTFEITDNGDDVDVAFDSYEDNLYTMSGLDEDPADEDWSYGMTRYGALIKHYDAGSADADDVVIDYPLSQRGAQVFVTAGGITVAEGSSLEGGALETTTLHAIPVGLALLDSEADGMLGTENLIVVGGPCANTVAFELMGQPENCAEGFEPGKAKIKLFTSQNALLVAGHGAQDTLGACYVLAKYADYNLEGTEVEVVAADLSALVVNKVE